MRTIITLIAVALIATGIIAILRPGGQTQWAINFSNELTKKLEEAMTPLHLAAAEGSTKKVKKLLDKGTDVNERSDFGSTALQYAVQGGRKETVELLISRGADVNAKNKFGVTPLFAASAPWCKSPDEIIKLLIAHGADINVQDLMGETPLHRAVRHARPDVVRLLLEAGADTTLEDKRGLTPWEFAEAYCGRGPRVTHRIRHKEKREECSRLIAEHKAKQ